MAFGEEAAAVASVLEGEDAEIRGGGDGSIDYVLPFPQAAVPAPEEDGADVAMAGGQSVLPPTTSPGTGMLPTATPPVRHNPNGEPKSSASEPHFMLPSPEESPSEDEVEPEENGPDEGMVEDLVDENVIAAEKRDQKAIETVEGIGGVINDGAESMGETTGEANIEVSSGLSEGQPASKYPTLLDVVGQFEPHNLLDLSRNVPAAEQDYVGAEDEEIPDGEMQNDADEEVVLLTGPLEMEELLSAADEFAADNFYTMPYFDGTDERNANIASYSVGSTITGSGTVWAPIRRRRW